MTTQFIRFLPMYPAVSAVFLLLNPSTAAAANLPGWGIDGTPAVDSSWCQGTNETAYPGDFNGDGQTDMLCHDSVTGRKLIDFSDSDYLGLWGTDWSSTDYPAAAQTWCTNAGERILVGDYNGDGKDDLLCHVLSGYNNPGRKRIDFANASGTFYGTEFNTQNHAGANQTWCTNAGESLFVGDFNGDGKDDLLCFVARGSLNAGRRRIDFANASGAFFGTNWNSQDYPNATQAWCVDAGETRHVGDYNGDGRDDLLCFVNRGFTNAGRRRIDFANGSGTFFGTEFNSAGYAGADQDWCTEPDRELKVADFNGDGKDDLLCAQPAGLSGFLLLGNLQVDHANSNGTFFGTNGAIHYENWCPGTAVQFHLGDFDGDGQSDVLCHDAASGYRGVRYANPVGDFYSICSITSTKGDGMLDALPVHFAVVADPNHPDVSTFRGSWMPTATSSHTHPLTGNSISQVGDSSRYFKAELDLINNYTSDYSGNSVCVGDDCIWYEYDSHALYTQISSTSCTEVLNYSNPPDERYAANCRDTNIWDEDDCFPNTCDGPYADAGDAWIYGFACAIQTCNDLQIYKPHTLNILIMDRCDWDTIFDEINDTSCEDMNMSFGINEDPNEQSDFFTAWDFVRVLRGSASPSGWERAGAKGVEQHELGHVLSLGHTSDCAQNKNAMDKSSGCPNDGEVWRDGGYSSSIQGVNQIDTMVDAARSRVRNWSCN